jgi:hypothetical protein
MNSAASIVLYIVHHEQVMIRNTFRAQSLTFVREHSALLCAKDLFAIDLHEPFGGYLASYLHAKAVKMLSLKLSDLCQY